MTQMRYILILPFILLTLSGAEVKDPPEETLEAAADDSLAIADSGATPSGRLYPGVTPEQDELAQNVLRSFFLFDWVGVDRNGRRLQRLERRRRLPPLSCLLLTGIGVIRIQNGEYASDRERREILREIRRQAARGFEVADTEKVPDSLSAIADFIAGGIKGFVATLKIDRSPVSAALNGFSAVKLLRRAAKRDPAMADVCLGLGLYNCALAKAPPLVRGALALVGRDVSLERGLDHLRRCVAEGCYTSEIAKLFLADFLTPYLGHEAAEKKEVLRSLHSRYPENAYFTFLEAEENLCFHPDTFFSISFTEDIRGRVPRFSTEGYCLERYSALVKWQLLLANPFPSPGFAPDTTFDLRNYGFYPVFLRALREKRLYEREFLRSEKERQRRLRHIREQGALAARLLDATDMMADNRKGLFQWHIRDALRIERGNGRE